MGGISRRRGTDIQSAFVSSNSITQGEQALTIWETLMNRGIAINFAYRTFVWDSEASQKAHVHCVIIGFSTRNRKRKVLYANNGTYSITNNINPYLISGSDSYVTARKDPLCDVPKMIFGNQPRDGGALILSYEEKCEIYSHKSLKYLFTQKELKTKLLQYFLVYFNTSVSK